MRIHPICRSRILGVCIATIMADPSGTAQAAPDSLPMESLPAHAVYARRIQSGGGWRGVLVYWPKVYGYDVVGNRPRTEPDYAWKPEGTEMQGWMDQATMRSFGRADLFSPELTMSITFEAAASGSVYRDADAAKEPMPIIWDSRAQVQAWHAQVRDEILKKLEAFLMPKKGSGTVSSPPGNPTTENAERLWIEGKTAYEAGDLVGAEEKALASVKLLPKPERVDFANKLQKANQLWKEGQELYKRKDYDGTLAVCTESIALASSQARVKFVESLRKLASSQKTPARRMVRMEGGVYTRGNVLGDKEAGSTPGEFSEPVEEPAHKIEVSAFEIENLEVTKALWDEVASWARARGYELRADAAGKAASHPVQSVTWYDCVKWCNARSEKESLRPCYYTDAAYTQVLRTGTAS